MKVTLNHPESVNGFPVIVDGDGNVVPQSEGIPAILEKTGVSIPEFAAYCGVLPSTITKYAKTNKTPGHVLNALGLVLKTKGEIVRKANPPELTATEQKIVALRDAGFSFGDIARKIGGSRQRAHQILQAAIGKLRIAK
jgi:predicted transcriptional regulator